MDQLSPPKGAGDGRKRGDFMFAAISFRRGVADTVSGGVSAGNAPKPTGVLPTAA
jgi:hypothetical protein